MPLLRSLGYHAAMVKLPINMSGYAFQDGVQTLQASFLSARDALAGEVARAKDEAVAYQQEVDREGEWIGECDEDGRILWDQADVLNMRIDTTNEALIALRKAFAIAVYHHWERSALRWLDKKREDHDKLAIAVQALGYPIHPKLAAVRDLVNTLKHDSGRWGCALIKSWSDLFEQGYLPRAGWNAWYEAVRLSDEHVLEAISVVSASGPTAES
jgi:hypothetical protein